MLTLVIPQAAAAAVRCASAVHTCCQHLSIASKNFKAGVVQEHTQRQRGSPGRRALQTAAHSPGAGCCQAEGQRGWIHRLKYHLQVNASGVPGGWDTRILALHRMVAVGAVAFLGT
ncbi:hypothetical protein VaNZ11_000749 [Volvox africanus]|uniref:Secreted protein n=1 Tax=Volvox africanus TaxID=51714 RepID=A0ABQ5RND6_9CHLO|nr:hypothetical protein VaNZ11_000749 [Volvox africanus]